MLPKGGVTPESRWEQSGYWWVVSYLSVSLSFFFTLSLTLPLPLELSRSSSPL